MFDSADRSRLVLGGGGDMTAIGESTTFLWSCIPFVLAILSGREGVD